MTLKFTGKQADFLNNELSLNIKPDTEYNLDESTIDKILDNCMDIEVEEIEEADSECMYMSVRGDIAADICDLIMAPSLKIQRVK